MRVFSFESLCVAILGITLVCQRPAFSRSVRTRELSQHLMGVEESMSPFICVRTRPVAEAPDYAARGYLRASACAKSSEKSQDIMYHRSSQGQTGAEREYDARRSTPDTDGP